MKKHNRREFVLGSGCFGLSGAAFAASFDKLSLMNLFASQAAPNDANYKAMVCVFLFGGNDANNFVIPYDNYAPYDAARNGSPFAVAQADLLQIYAASQGQTFGLPNRGTYNLTGINDLYQRGRLAFIVNMGSLAQPLTRAEFLANPSRRPQQLFSHSNQQTQNQTAVAVGASPTGWGGRLADRVRGGNQFPIQVSVSGVNVYTAAQLEQPLVVPPTGALNTALRFDPPRQGIIDAVRSALAIDGGSPLKAGMNNLTAQALATRAQLSTDPTVGAFPNTAIGNQLKQISKFISLRNVLSQGGPMRRQIFFASMGGYDTHANQNASQGNNLTQLSAAIAAFDAEMVRQEAAAGETAGQGLSRQVTLFTQSDFARTFKIGTRATGTDHAWGSHQLVTGGAVNGGDFYGTFPTLALDGPDDVDTGVNARGRWLPTTSVAQVGATLAKWFGVSDADMTLLFPSIRNFSPADLGFMGT